MVTGGNTPRILEEKRPHIDAVNDNKDQAPVLVRHGAYHTYILIMSVVSAHRGI